jgi:Spy/CpxP family protein refolding chaperone
MRNRSATEKRFCAYKNSRCGRFNKKGVFVKKLVLTVIVNGALAMGLAAASIPARAQDQDAQSTGTRQMRSPDEVVQKLGEKLNLTDDQKEQIKPIIADRQQKLQALRSDTGRRRQKAREAKSILEDSDKKIKAILTPDQQKQYAELEQQMKERRQERRQTSNGGDSSN